MSIFFNSKKFYKPGPGVEADEPKKRAFFRFFELYGRKIWKYIEINAIYFVILLPMILFIYSRIYLVGYNAAESYGFELIDFYTFFMECSVMYIAYVPRWLQYILIAASAIAYGPAKAGITYVMQNFSEERHAWLTDIWEKAKENLGQSIFFGILDLIVYILTYYNLVVAPGSSGLENISKYVTVLVFVIYGFMKRYIYQMIVTIQLSIPQILRNAWLLAFIGIFRNVGVSLVNGGLWVLLVILIAKFEILEIPLLLLFIYSFTMFLGVFATRPLIRKYLVEPALAQQASQEESADQSSVEGEE